MLPTGDGTHRSGEGSVAAERRRRRLMRVGRAKARHRFRAPAGRIRPSRHDQGRTVNAVLSAAGHYDLVVAGGMANATIVERL